MAESFYSNLTKKLSSGLSQLIGSKPKDRSKATDSTSPESDEATKGSPTAKQKPRAKSIPIGKTMVDLTPDVYKDAVRVRQLKKQWLLINGGILAIAVLSLSILFVSTIGPKAQLDSLLESNQELQSQLIQYQELNTALEQAGTIQNKLNAAAGNEIDWDKLFGALQGTLPSGVTMTSIGINAASAQPEVGANILISFSANSPLGYADTLRAVQSAEGVSNVQIGGMTSGGEGAYQYSATLTYDGSIKTGRFKTSDQILLEGDGSTGGSNSDGSGGAPVEDEQLSPLFDDTSDSFGSEEQVSPIQDTSVTENSGVAPEDGIVIDDAVNQDLTGGN